MTSGEKPQTPAPSSQEVHEGPWSPTPAADKPRSIWRSPRSLVALILAAAADALQLWLLPIFAPGISGIVDGGLDLAVGAALVALLGWHLAFLPAFINELVPFLDLFPTWTAAVVFVVARKSGRHSPNRGN